MIVSEVVVDLKQLRCFLAVAEELHFGRAARRLEMLPSALGRHVRLLEESLNVRLVLRTTRSVRLSEQGADFLDEARTLLAQADDLARRMRERGKKPARWLRLGAIDTAAAGLLPSLLHDLRESRPGIAVQLYEEKSIKLLPRLLSGRLDLALVRPREHHDNRIEFMMLFNETAVVAVPSGHKLANRRRLTIGALADQPLIVPDRGSRPHSHDLTIKLFQSAGLKPRIAQVAEEKQTIVNLVASDLGLAIVPRWTSRMVVPGVRFIQLQAKPVENLAMLPLAAAWVKGSRDLAREEILKVLVANLGKYAATA